MRATTTSAPLAPLHQLLVVTDAPTGYGEPVAYMICDPNLPTPNDVGCADDPYIAAQFAASGPMLVALMTTRDNLRSMMAASAAPEHWREWLTVVEEALAAARDTESIR